MTTTDVLQNKLQVATLTDDDIPHFENITLDFMEDGIHSHAVVCDPKASKIMTLTDMDETIDKIVSSNAPAISDGHGGAGEAEEAPVEAAANLVPKFLKSIYAAAFGSSSDKPRSVWQAQLAQEVMLHSNPSPLAQGFWKSLGLDYDNGIFKEDLEGFARIWRDLEVFGRIGRLGLRLHGWKKCSNLSW